MAIRNTFENQNKAINEFVYRFAAIDETARCQLAAELVPILLAHCLVSRKHSLIIDDLIPKLNQKTELIEISEAQRKARSSSTAVSRYVNAISNCVINDDEKGKGEMI